MADNVEIKFLGDVTGLRLSITQLSEMLRGIMNPIAGVRAQLGEMAEAFAAAFAVEKISEFVMRMGELGEQTERAAAILGVSTEDVGRLGLMAKAGGVSLEGLEMAFGRLSRSIIEQSDTTKRALAALGLSFADIAPLSANERLALLADKFSGIKDGADKAAIAMALFGRTGEMMIPFLNKGSEGIAEFNMWADRLGVTLSGETTAALAEVHKNTVLLGGAIQGMQTTGFIPFVGTMNALLAFLRDTAEEFTNNAREAGTFSAALNAAFRVVVTALIAAKTGFQELWAIGSFAVRSLADSLSSTGAGFVALGAGIGTLGTTIKGVFLAIVTGVGGAFTAIWEGAKVAVTGIGTLFADLGALVKAAFTGNFSEAWAKLQADAAGAVTGIADKVAEARSKFDFSDVKPVKFDFSEADTKTAEFGERQKARTAELGKTLSDLNTRAMFQLGRTWADGEARIEAEHEKHNARMGSPDKNARDRVAAAMKAIDGEIKAEQAGLAQKTAIYGIEASTHQIRESERIEKVRAATDAEYAAELALLRKELDIQGMKLAQRQEVENKITALENKHRLDEITLDKEAISERQKTWEGYFGAVQGAFNGQLRGLLAGTTSFRTAMKSIFGDLIISVIQGIEKMVFEWIAGQIGMTAATTAGVAARTTAETAGSAAGILSMITNALKAIASGVGATIAGVSGAVAPIAGPAAPAAGIAAGAAVEAAAMGALPAHEIGAWRIGSIGPALLHPGEMVLPGPSAEMMRNALVGGGSGGGGDTHLHFPGVMDTRGFIQAISNHSSPIARIIGKAMTRNPSTRPAY